MSSDEGKLRDLTASLELMTTEDIVLAVSSVFARRANIVRTETGAVDLFEGYVIADVGYSAPEPPMIELVAFDAEKTRRIGFYEQGRCPKCTSFICSEVKDPLCAVCGTFTECT